MYLAIRWPKAMASLALPGMIDAVLEKKIMAVSVADDGKYRFRTSWYSHLFSAECLIGEFFSGEVGGEHESALGDGEDRHAGLVVSIRSGIRRRPTCLRRGPIGTDAGRRAPGNGDGACAGIEFELARFELIEGTLVLEKDDLAVRFPAGLKSNAQLRHRRIADDPVMHVHVTLASRAADDQPA